MTALLFVLPVLFKFLSYCLQCCVTHCVTCDIGASAKLELVDKFCYLGDMLSVDGDGDATVEARIRIG